MLQKACRSFSSFGSMDFALLDPSSLLSRIMPITLRRTGQRVLGAVRAVIVTADI